MHLGTIAHIAKNVQVWDGYKYSLVPVAEAKKLVKAGTHQITTNLSSSQLKRPNEFKPVVQEETAEPETESPKKRSWEA